MNSSTGYDTVAIGTNALYSNSSGNQNVAIGYNALTNNTTANSNVAVGNASLDANTTGTGNTALGQNSLPLLTTGSVNTAIGKDAAPQLTTGGYNVCVGREVGINLASGSFNTYMGYLAGTNDSTRTSCIVIGAGNVFHADKGNSTGFINPNSGPVYQGNNSSSWSTTSDRRIKKNIKDNNVGLDAINQIRVRNFEYRTEDEITEVTSGAAINKEGVQLGVIAQEIETILPDTVTEESTGVKSVNPDNLTWYLVNAVKELSTQVDELKAEITTLKGE